MDGIEDNHKLDGHPTLTDGARILAGLRLAGVNVWRWRLADGRLEWTDRIEVMSEADPETFEGPLASLGRDVHPEDAQRVKAAIERTLATGEPYRVVYRAAPVEGREEVCLEACGGLIHDPDDGVVLTGARHDVTRRVRDERELAVRLRQQRAIERLGSFALTEEDFQAVLDRAAETAADVLGTPITKILQFADSADHLVLKAGTGWRGGLVGVAAVGVDAQSQAGYTLTHESPVVVRDLASETRFSGPMLLKDHGVRSGVSVVIPGPGPGPRPFGVIGVHDVVIRDFTEADVEFVLSLANIIANAARQKAAHEQRYLLLREMAHRSGNMLQLVSTIANQTFGEGADVNVARHSFSARLGSLARANYLVAQGGWTSTRVVALLAETLEPFRDRIDFRGRDILLPPDLCFDLGLIIHELATNSAKYGALASGEGRVSVSWTLKRAGANGSDADGEEDDGDCFSLAWEDGSAHAGPPSAGRGFGSRLLRALIERKWAGKIETNHENGYRFRMEMRVPRE
ncbi:MAG: PAS domain-containing protein [Microvirga sp.]|nr:PAS domain-containing protein [Microvirga sp.]